MVSAVALNKNPACVAQTVPNITKTQKENALPQRATIVSMKLPLLIISVCGVLALGAGTAVGGYLASQKNNESAVAPQKNTTTATTISAAPATTTHQTLTFTADTGVRMEDGSNAGVKIVDGALEMLYESHGTETGPHLASATQATDWLTFSGVKQTNPDTFRALQLPDGTWRAYGLDTTVGNAGSCLQSQSSTDGITYTKDAGCRYTLQDSDNGRMGVYELFNRQNSDVVLLYLGDLEGKNNVRKAVSTDGGWTFIYDSGDVFDTGNTTRSDQSYVDEKVIRLNDGTLYVVAMKAGVIYSFISKDDGETFTSEGEILKPSDFDTAALSLHDPQIIELPDGRYRIFVTLFTGGGQEKNQIVSATAPAL